MPPAFDRPLHVSRPNITDPAAFQEATPIFTLSGCFRNVIEEWAPEFFDALFGDRFFWSMLEPQKFMEEVQSLRKTI